MFFYDRRLILIVLLTIMAAMATIPSCAYAAEEKTIYTPEEAAQAPPGIKLTPIYGAGKRQVDRAETIKNLPDNDVDRLPRVKAYSDTTGRGPGAGARGELVLAEVRYEPKGWDEDGIPNNYTAYVVYRGEETYLQLTHYEAVTARASTVTGEETTDSDEIADEDDAPVAEPYEPAVDEGGDDPDAGGVAAADGGGATPAKLPFSLSAISPLGAAAVATLVAAVLTLVMLGIYSRRRIRESVPS